MEFRKDSGIHGQLVPETPGKPTSVKRPAPAMSGLNRALDSADVAGGSGVQWRSPNHGQMAALASASQGQIGELRAMAFNMEGLAPVSSYRELLEMNDPTIVSKMSLPHFMLGRMGDGGGSGRGRSTSNMQGVNAELSHRRFSLPPNRGNGGSRLMPPLAPKPHYMSEFPFLNLNSVPENYMSNTVVSQAMPPPATPATMEKNQNQREGVRVRDHQPIEIIDLEAETSSFQDLLHNRSSQFLQSLAENPAEQCFSNEVESTQIVNSQHQEGERNVVVNSSEGGTIQQAEGANEGIDLNKTPPPKPKRKKHRPKVVREGKPARTPKPVTPKPPKTTENPSGKRKYVRKKKDTAPEETHTTPGMGEVVDQDSRNRNKPVRRGLNFDLEPSQPVDRLSGSAPMMPGHYVYECQRQEAHATMENVATRNSSDVHCSQGQGPVALGRLMGCGAGFDLNRSTAEFGNESVRIPQTPCQPPRPSGQGMTREKWQQNFEKLQNNMNASSQSGARDEGNMKKLARQTSSQNIPSNLDMHLGDHQRQVASNTNSEAARQGGKRCHGLVDNAQVSANISYMQANGSGMLSGSHNESFADTCFLDIHKRRRIENDQKETIPNASSVSTSAPSGWRTVRNMRNTNEVSTFADAQRMAELQKIQGFNRMVDFNQVEMATYDGRTQDHRLMSTTSKLHVQNQIDCMPPYTPEKAPGYRNGQETESFGPQARVETPIAKQTKAKPRGRRKKEQNPLVNSMASNANQTENVAAAVHVGSPTIESKHQNSRMKIAQHCGSPAQDCHNRSSYQATTSPRLQSGSQAPYCDPVDEIVRKLGHLEINGDQEDIEIHPQNALVPYVGVVGTMVPFEGQFNFTKKRKPRAKVDLDPESHRVWKLLMGKESSEGEDGTQIDKEKWWEEERRVFRGRADSFIARMHLIQGDRRFSRWKGSVVDSVIGVFLTQNVSDHLSSSAFMSLAARFPPQIKGNNKVDTSETISRPIVANDASRRKGELSNLEFGGRSSLWVSESERRHNKETVYINESLESNCGCGSIDYSEESCLEFRGIEIGTGQESPDSALGTEVTVNSCTSAVEGDDRKSQEDVFSSQNSVASSQNSSECPGQTTYQCQPSQLLNFEADELLTGSRTNCFGSFRELLEMADGMALNDLKDSENGRILSAEHSGMIDWSAALQSGKSSSIENGLSFLNGSGTSIYSSNSHHHLAQHDIPSLSCAPPSSYRHQSFSTSSFVGMEKANGVINDSSQSYIPSTLFELNETNKNETLGRVYSLCSASSTNDVDRNEPLTSKIPLSNLLGPINNNNDQPTCTGVGVRHLQSERHSYCQSEASLKKNVPSTCLNQVDANAVMFQQREWDAELQMERTRKVVEGQAEVHNFGTYKTSSNLHNNNEMNGKVAEYAAEANVRNEVSISEKVSAETLNSASKGKKVKSESEKKSFDWDSLRRQVCQNDAKNERSGDSMDSLDYEALRNADVSEISNTIRERGMNNMLAERMKDFLNRLVRDHGSIDLEWLRDVPPDKTKDYLLSIRGLGLKSVECVRLLTLHHLAFPVDTNVGRICVRLGWVPLQPLPESLQLHLLEMYPMLETIQKYLWPRLCKLDQRTLYELHYQLITFGKVFCTKSKPNCNACPMRGECKHFASAFASARLALPGPEEKHLVRAEVPFSFERSTSMASIPVPLRQLEGSALSKEQTVPRNCEPIIEEPASPEPEFIETSEIDIEDAFYNDPDEIPTIKLNFEEFTQNLQNYMQENNLGLQEGDMSKALVAISPEAASIPMPKLKNISRLRTEHQVYELPDTHPLLEGLDKREPDDPCPYLLAIWTPGETAQSTEPPTASCNFQDTGKLCDKNTCFSCNSVREAQSQMVRGTLLIPCRTANKGSFPLNGTYFQVNEVFADHDSSRSPIDVPRDWIWKLPRRTVYFGTSVPSIFKGLTTEEIQHCFWRGFVCVRGFDRKLRAPRPLFARLHFRASQVARNRKAAGAAAREEE